MRDDDFAFYAALAVVMVMIAGSYLFGALERRWHYVPGMACDYAACVTTR